jgi:predicted HicB family RNase H-like nuclease
MTMEYKHYRAGPIDFDQETGLFSGTVLGLKDDIHFEGMNAGQVLASFRNGIDAYLALCAERREKPDKPFSGEVEVRIAPVLHRKAAIRAAREGVTLDQWIARQIEVA